MLAIIAAIRRENKGGMLVSSFCIRTNAILKITT
jgi:hypothetical protein